MEEGKEVYLQKRQAELKELEMRLEVLESTAEKADAEAKIGYGEQIYELKEKRDNLEADIAELKRADDKAWKDLRSKIDEATTDLRTAIDVASTRFK